jgi:hypothetical protein
MELGAAALVTALSALLGAWAGAQLALRRFKKERTFDARFQWYADAVRLCHEAARRIDIALRVHRGDQVVPESLADAPTVNQAAVDSVSRVSDHIHGGVLLADRESLEALGKAVKNAGLSRGLARGSPTERWPPLILAFQLTADTIARQGRKHLGLERLPPEIATAIAALSTQGNVAGSTAAEGLEG